MHVLPGLGRNKRTPHYREGLRLRPKSTRPSSDRRSLKSDGVRASRDSWCDARVREGSSIRGTKIWPGHIRASHVGPNDARTSHWHLSGPSARDGRPTGPTTREVCRRTLCDTGRVHSLGMHARIVFCKAVIGPRHVKAVLRPPAPLRGVIRGRVKRYTAPHAAGKCGRGQRRGKEERAHQEP
jgi:hypothetical protein